jgi:hypothetical protein
MDQEMNIQEQIDILTAYRDGRTIQWYTRKAGFSQWVDVRPVVDRGFDFSATQYRIKPEDEYRWYTDAELLKLTLENRRVLVRNKGLGVPQVLSWATVGLEDPGGVYADITEPYAHLYEISHDGTTWQPLGVKV